MVTLQMKVWLLCLEMKCLAKLQDLGDSLYKDYVVGIEKLTGDFDAILYLEDVNYSTEEVNLLLKDILTDVAA